jgi:hypothetical protein
MSIFDEGHAHFRLERARQVAGANRELVRQAGAGAGMTSAWKSPCMPS